ncbi:MAG: helix-turn-helix domain-containing protein, partial [Patescibacteria group bacterium]
MKTVGSILKSERLAKGYTLEAVEQATKIRVKFLEAIENDNFQILPSASYAKGFVKNYSEFLGLESSTVLAFFRRQTRDIPKTSLLPNVPQPLNRPLFALTPGRFLTLLLISLLFVFLLYFSLQYRRLRQPPLLILE